VFNLDNRLQKNLIAKIFWENPSYGIELTYSSAIMEPLAVAVAVEGDEMTKGLFQIMLNS
jgi:hypothetical protein